jgi:hypothetical protein
LSFNNEKLNLLIFSCNSSRLFYHSLDSNNTHTSHSTLSVLAAFEIDILSPSEYARKCLTLLWNVYQWTGLGSLFFVECAFIFSKYIFNCQYTYKVLRWMLSFVLLPEFIVKFFICNCCFYTRILIVLSCW